MNGTSPLASTASWPHARSRWAAQATRAALIPIRKSEAWWDLAQDERRLNGGYLRLPGYGGEECDDVVGERLGPRTSSRPASCSPVPVAVDAVGWLYALLPLAAGPLLGTVAMLRLHRLPTALGLANGRR